MEGVARLMVVAGVAAALAGGALWVAARLGLGRLPGDIVVQRGDWQVAVPVATSIVVSVLLTVALNVAVRLLQ